jgi:pimeloyl-ACP methyl ester carboxylesterase
MEGESAMKRQAMGCMIIVLSLVLIGSNMVSASLPKVPMMNPPTPTPVVGEGLGDLTDSAPLAILQSSHTGNSPIEPPEEDDGTFVTDTGFPTMDVYLFRDESPIVFDIEIDRCLGESPDEVYLKLVVWDVDEDFAGDPDHPDREREIDRVHVNNHYVGDLTGANQTWSVTQLEVDAEYLNFPQDCASPWPPTPAANRIRIDIDTANEDIGELVWAVEVDWGALIISNPRLPIVLVHGWTGSASSSASSWDTFKGFLDADGIPYRVATTLDPMGSISYNAGKIREEINAAKLEYGVDKVNLVAHSKGGVDSRRAIRYARDVENLVQLASPNHGTKTADWWYALRLWGDPDLQEITTWWIERYFNYQWDLSTKPPTLLGIRYVKNPKVDYRIIIGTAGGIPGDLPFVDLEDPHDGFVSKLGATFPWNPSVSHTYPLPGEENVDKTFDLNHSGIKEDKAVYEWVMEQLYPGMYPSAAAKLEGVGVQESETATTLTSFESPQSIINLSAEITTGETLTHTITVDTAAQASFVIATLDADLGLVLYDPDGVRIDPTVAAGDPDIEYSQTDAEEWGKYTSYTIQNPIPGDWQMEVAATVGGTYVATVEIDNDTSLLLSTDKGSYQANEEIQITAIFADGGTPITGASAIATIQKSDQTTDTLSLYDDGTHGDAISNDGVYFNTYAGTSVTGYTDIFVTAIATGVRREASTHIVVAPTTAQLTGSYSEIPVDSDGDGLYNTLRINVGLDVSLAGDYEVSGVLQDASGNTIVQAGFSTLLEGSGELGVGQQFVSLDFDGGLIYQHGVDGPYFLKHVVVYDQNDVSIQTDYVQDAYTTSAYAYTNFQRDVIVLTGNNSDVGVDTDGDGFFDYLNVNLEFDVLIPGPYNVNARLVDSDGGEIVWASTDVYLSGGAQVIQLQFDGTKIGEHSVDGPYVVRDLTIFITTGGTSAIFDNVHVTSAYHFWEFEGVVVQKVVFLPLILKNYPPDTTPPATVTNLSTSNPTLDSITLNWTAPGDDCNTGTAWKYDIRYSTSPITDASWNAAAQCAGEPAPQPAGSSETFTIHGLTPNTTHYFALKTADEVPNWSCLSNVASGTTLCPDTTPPAAVTNLATSNPTLDSITLNWTAPGDDGNTGTASKYDIRYSTSPITDANWNVAAQCAGEPAPKPAGSSETYTVNGLNPNTTHYFALKTADEVPNWSGLSNVASRATLRPSDQLIINCGFETDEGWVFGETPRPAAYTTEDAHWGNRSVRLGIKPPTTDAYSWSSVRQRITIPANAKSATLSFWYKPFSEAPCGGNWQQFDWSDYSVDQPGRIRPSRNPLSWASCDWQQALILADDFPNPTILATVMNITSNSGVWTHETFDLTPFAGRTVWVYFNVYNDGWGYRRTWMYVDDASVMVYY